MKSTRLALVAVALSGCVTAPPSHDEMLADLDRAKSQLAARQDSVEFSGSLHDYIAAALRDRPELVASYQRWRAAALKVGAVGTWPEPMGSYSYFLRSVETRVGPQRHKIGLTQPIPWPTKLSTGKRVASAAAKGEEAKYEAQMLMTRMRVSQIFWRAWLVAQVRHWRKQQAWCEQEQDRHGKKSAMGKAIGYFLRQWEHLTRFLHDVDVEPSNNWSERLLRVIALGRKNWLFVGHETAGQNTAALCSLVASCELHGLNPEQYLADMLMRIQTHAVSRLHELLPPNYAALLAAEASLG